MAKRGSNYLLRYFLCSGQRYHLKQPLFIRVRQVIQATSTKTNLLHAQYILNTSFLSNPCQLCRLHNLLVLVSMEDERWSNVSECWVLGALQVEGSEGTTAICVERVTFNDCRTRLRQASDWIHQIERCPSLVPVKPPLEFAMVIEPVCCIPTTAMYP